MGCCFSSSKKHHHNPPPRSASNGRDPPPPPPLEEETVKEVLSETPIPKPHHPPKVPLLNDKEADFPQVKVEPTAVVKPTSDETKFDSMVVVKPCDDMKFESTAVIKPEVSEEPSEMYSFTESYSTTATATEKREEDGEVTQRSPIRVYRKRQNSGDLTGVRERSFRSQPGRSAPSPEKRRSSAQRGVQGRGMTAQRRNVGPPNGTRRSPADNGVRRSKSPATRRPAEQRKSEIQKSGAREEEKLGGQSPARSVKAENEGSSSRAEKPKEEVLPESGESHENALVSMECFIFL